MPKKIVETEATVDRVNQFSGELVIGLKQYYQLYYLLTIIGQVPLYKSTFLALLEALPDTCRAESIKNENVEAGIVYKPASGVWIVKSGKLVDLPKPKFSTALKRQLKSMEIAEKYKGKAYSRPKLQ